MIVNQAVIYLTPLNKDGNNHKIAIARLSIMKTNSLFAKSLVTSLSYFNNHQHNTKKITAFSKTNFSSTTTANTKIESHKTCQEGDQ